METKLNKKIFDKIIEIFNSRKVYEKVGNKVEKIGEGSEIVKEISLVFEKLIIDRNDDAILDKVSEIAHELGYIAIFKELSDKPRKDGKGETKDDTEDNSNLPQVKTSENNTSNTLVLEAQTPQNEELGEKGIDYASLNKQFKLDPLKSIKEANGIKEDAKNEIWSNSPILDSVNIKTLEQLMAVINLITKIKPKINTEAKTLSSGKQVKVITVKYINRTRAITLKFVEGGKKVDVYFVGNYKAEDIKGLESIGVLKKKIENKYELRSLELPSTLEDSTLRVVAREFLQIKTIF